MDTYRVRLIGESPLLMHADDIKWRGLLEAWVSNPENKRASRAGDDRTPAWKWLGYCYHDTRAVGVPADNLMTALREGGAKVPVSGKKNLTYKRQSQSGLVVNELLWPLSASKGAVLWPDLATLIDEPDFAVHERRAEQSGFELFSKGAKVGQSKHIRVRPRFNAWACEGSITVFDETITRDVLQTILEMAGVYCGLGDWRPSSPSRPGPWGRFKAELAKV